MGLAMGVPAGTLRAYSCGKTQGVPSLDFLSKLAKLADVGAVLAQGAPLELQTIERKREHADVLVKVYENLNSIVSYGALKAPMINLELRTRYPKNALSILGITQDEMLIARLKDNKMSPLLEAGDFVLIENRVELISGEMIIFEYGGEVFVKLIEKNPITGGIKFFSKNKESPDFELPAGVDEKFKMIGIVRGRIKIF